MRNSVDLDISILLGFKRIILRIARSRSKIGKTEGLKKCNFQNLTHIITLLFLIILKIVILVKIIEGIIATLHMFQR